jgi:hypothetical protein
MRPCVWFLSLLGGVLIVGMVACGSQLPAPTNGLPPPEKSTVESTTVAEVEELGPLPEYHLVLGLNATERRLEGRQEVVIPNCTGQDLSEIVFRLYPNLPQYGGLVAIGPVWVDGQPRISSLRAEGTSLVIPLAQPLAPQASVAISLTFEVEIPQRSGGYVLFGHSQGIWSLPDAYPLLAVHDGSIGPSGPEATWHEDLAPAHGDAVFADVALYDVILTVPSTMTVAATGSVVSEVEERDGQRMVHVVSGPLREFAWLASADYSIAETIADGATVRSYYLPGDEAAGEAALNTAAAALRVYADAFGPYPFAEMAVAEAPLLHYGMEYPGLNLIGLDLYRERREELENRVAHEIAHQWWYAQVGNDQVRVPWLDEGLAEHSTATYYREVFGQARANTLINQRWLVPYQAAVENGYDAVVNQPTAAFGREYEVIVYGKGALFFEALRQRLGGDLFEAALREYVDHYRWQIATPDGFLRVMESVSGQDLDDLYARWILGK